MKTFLKILLFALFAFVLLFAISRYGWRLAGFAACDDPHGSYVERITLENGCVFISGGTADSFSAYVGCIYEITDGKLYVGVKHNAFLGFFQRIGTFSIAVPANAQAVSAVYLKGGAEERLIWTQADGMTANSAANQAPVQDAGPSAEDTHVQASYPFDGADAENDLCAVVFLGYDEASASDAVTRLCNECPALQELLLAGKITEFDANGAEQYWILPKYTGTVITVNRVTLSDEGTLQPEGEALTTESPLRIYANVSDIVPSTQITVQLGAQSICFSPFISLKDEIIAEIEGAFTMMG